MGAALQHASEVLTAVSEEVARLDEFAYSLVLRFNAVKRRHARAHLLNGGHISIACSFAVDAAEKRWFIWAITGESMTGDWQVRASAEEEEDCSGSILWESTPYRATTPADFVAALQQAHAALEGSLAIPRIAEIGALGCGR